MCGYVRTTFGTIVANCDWPSHYWDSYWRVWEKACTRNAVWSSVLPFSCRHMAVGDNVQVDFWGMYQVLCIFLSPQLSTLQHLGHLSQSLVDLFDIMCSEVPSSRPSASEALDCVRGLKLSHDILMSHVPQSAPAG